MRKGNSLSVYIVAFLCAFFASFVFVFTFLECVNNFVVIQSMTILVIASLSGIALSIIVVVCIALRRKKVGESKVGFWFSNNSPKLILGYFLLLLFLESVTADAIWTADELNDILTLEWTIFGLSLTIFLVWNVLIVDYLKKKRPVETESLQFLQKYRLLLERQSFSQEVELTFSTIVFLSINLILLLVSSSLLFIVHKPESLITQNFIRCAFFFSTNTIVSLFFDILKPLKKDKDDLKAGNRVTKGELDAALGGTLLQTIIETEIEQISKLENITDEEKKLLTVRCLEEWKDAITKAKKPESEHEPKEPIASEVDNSLSVD